MTEIAVVKDIIAEGQNGDDEGKGKQQPFLLLGRPFPYQPGRKDIKQEIDKEGECEPVASFRGTESAEKQGWGSQQKQKDEGRHYLHHKLLLDQTSDSSTIPQAFWFLEKPAANEEEARQSEEEENVIPSHPSVTQAHTADMRIDHEDHRESPHGINVCNPASYHTTSR